jgi:hypothetical protein
MISIKFDQNMTATDKKFNHRFCKENAFNEKRQDCAIELERKRRIRAQQDDAGSA